MGMEINANRLMQADQMQGQGTPVQGSVDPHAQTHFESAMRGPENMPSQTRESPLNNAPAPDYSFSPRNIAGGSAPGGEGTGIANTSGNSGESVNTDSFGKKGGADIPSDIKGSSTGGQDSELQTNNPTQPSPSSLMESLFGNAMPHMQSTQGTQATTGTQQSAPTSQVNELVDTLVDRILVSTPGKGDPTVTLSISSGPLAGTELSLSRAVDGQLAVKLDCPDANSFQSAVGAQDALRTALERNEQNVRVEVNQQQASQNEDNDPRRRSRGLDEEYY